jgi:hypothetical protein
MRGLLLAALLPAAAWGQVCGDNDLSGGYGLQLSGSSTIAGLAKPMAVIGRVVFESGGHISGYSSVNFGGVFVGNPVTGNYTFKSDCSIAFELQDDSGAWQHFRGTLQPGGARGAFHQTDPGTGGRGILQKLPDACSTASLRGSFVVTMGSNKTVTTADGNGNFSQTTGDATNSGTYTVDSDCFVQMNFGVQLRGIVVNGGKTVLAVQTDPGKVSTATFNAQ